MLLSWTKMVTAVLEGSKLASATTKGRLAERRLGQLRQRRRRDRWSPGACTPRAWRRTKDPISIPIAGTPAQNIGTSDLEPQSHRQTRAHLVARIIQNHVRADRAAARIGRPG
jgi:hypothetical protein